MRPVSIVSGAILTLVLPALGGARASAQTSTGPTGPRGAPEAVARADKLVEAMGGADLWRELRSFHQRLGQAYVGAPDRMLEDEYLDLAEPRTRFEVRSEIYEQQRATSPAGGWILRNGEFRRYGEAELASAIEGAAGNPYRIVRRIARDDETLGVRFAEGSEHRLEFLDENDFVLCWIVVDVTGEPVLWGRSDVEWVFGPLVRFGNIRVPRWGAYTNGEWRYDVIEASASDDPPSVSFDPPLDTAGARRSGDSR